MKKFRILGIIAIIAILANFIGGLDEDWKDFKKGFEEGQSGATEMYESGHHMITRVKLNVKPLSGTTVDSLNNNRVDSPLPYTVTEIETYAKPSAWYILVIGLAIPGLFFFLIGFLLINPAAHLHLTPQSIYTSQCTTPTLVCIYQRKFKNSHSHRRMANRKRSYESN